MPDIRTLGYRKIVGVAVQRLKAHPYIDIIALSMFDEQKVINVIT